MSNPHTRHGGSLVPPGTTVVVKSAGGRAIPQRDPGGFPSPLVELGARREVDVDAVRVAPQVSNRRPSRNNTTKPKEDEIAEKALPFPHTMLSPETGSSKSELAASISSHGSYQIGAAGESQEASESQVGLRPQGNVPSYSLPPGERRRMHQIGYRNAFNNKGTMRWKHSRFHQHASLVYSSKENIRYRDAVGRVTTRINEDRFLDPFDVHLARLMVQSTDEIYSGPDNATWRRTFIRNQAPWAIRFANWPFNSVKIDKKHWDGSDWTMIVLKWPFACVGLAFTILKPGRLYPKASQDHKYAQFHYKYWGYPKVARNAIENAPKEGGPHLKTQTTHAVAERPLHPRRLCFLKDKSDPDSGITLYDVDTWMSKYNLVEHEMQYVFVAYTTNQFSHRDPEDIESLHNIAKQAAIDAGVGAYWIGASCMSDNKEDLEEDVFRISDVVRAAHSVVIAIKPSSNDAGTIDRMLQDWGKRMWTLPEALLSPKEQPLRIYSHSHGTLKLVKEVYKRNLAALIWDDSSMTRQLVDHYEGNLTLSRLELVILALGCLSNRATSRYLNGDLAYVLMGLLRQRPVVDRTDSEFQAFARLSLANDSDSLLERLICLLPQTPSQQWYSTEDAYNVNLWDIQHTCQIAGVGEDDTVILDGCYGASVQWEKFNAPWHCSRRSWKRRIAKCLLRIASLMFFAGILLAIYSSPNPSSSDGSSSSDDSFSTDDYSSTDGYSSTGGSSSPNGSVPNPYSGTIGALIGLALPIFLAAPRIVSVVYGGKVWNVDPHLLGFEGYLDLRTIESNIYGAPMGRLSWSTAGSPLSRHHKNEFGECIGDDPTSDPSVADIVKQAKYAGLGQEKVFTLVDTREGLVTLFSAARPPVAALICGQEGGMQRAVMVSLDHKRQTLYRETVLRMPTIVLERMYRTNRVRIGLKRPLDPTVPRSTIEC